MHRYRSHTCGQLSEADVGQTVRLSGWVHRKRDHGNLLFVDLRDRYGITQCVTVTGEANFAAVESVRPESVVTVTGPVVARSEETVNTALPTGMVEVRIDGFEVQSGAEELPMQVFGDQELSRRFAPALPVPRPAAREDAAQYRPASGGDRQHPPPHARSELP